MQEVEYRVHEVERAQMLNYINLLYMYGIDTIAAIPNQWERLVAIQLHVLCNTPTLRK